jgi:hypothetical protein
MPGQPNDVTITSDPSGRYLLLTYGGRGGFFTGWIDHSGLWFLPITQPYVEFPIRLGKDGRRQTT